MQRALCLLFILIPVFAGCKKRSDRSNILVMETVAMEPPGSTATATGFAVAGDDLLGDTKIRRPGKTTSFCTAEGCYDESGSFHPRKPSNAGTGAQNGSPPNGSPQNSSAATSQANANEDQVAPQSQPQQADPFAGMPRVDDKAAKWYTGDKKSYYLPVLDSNLWQHFDAAGKPTGWFFNKSTSQLVKPVAGKFDTGRMDFALNASDQVYTMSSHANGWKGEQQRVGENGALSGTGLTYYNGYGRFSQPTTAGSQAQWGSIYQIDMEQYRRTHPDAAIINYLNEKKQNGTVLVGAYPGDYRQGQAVNYYQPTVLQTIWEKPPQNGMAANPGATASTAQVASQPGTTAPTATTATTARDPRCPAGHYRLVSGIGCGYCPPQKALYVCLRDKLHCDVSFAEYNMNQPNPDNVSRFPNWKPGPPAWPANLRCKGYNSDID